MKKKVNITVQYQQIIDGEKTGSEIQLKGELLYGLKNCYLIAYDELNDEFNGCHVTVTVRNNNTVSLVRRGSYSTDIFVEQGKLQSSEYTTPYGSFTVEIYGKTVKSSIDTEKGEGMLTVEYTVDFSSNYITENKIKITLRPLGKE